MKTYFAVSHLGHLSAREVHDLYKLRTDIFVVEQKCPYGEIEDRDLDPATLHIRALENQRLVGCARVYKDGDTVHLGRVAVAADHRGTGIGERIMEETLALIEGQYPGATVQLDAQVASQGFYEKFGFTVAGEEYDWDGITQVPMTLAK